MFGSPGDRKGVGQGVGQTTPFSSKLRRERQVDRELRAATRGGFGRDVAVHSAAEVATDREAESGAFPSGAERSAKLNERLEDLFALVFRDSGPRIGHRDPC